MIENKEIYYDAGNKLLVSLPRPCELCKEEIMEAGFLFQKYSRSSRIGQTALVCCVACRDKARIDDCLYDHIEGNLITIVVSIRSSWNNFFCMSPIYKNSKNDMSVFEMADRQVAGETIIDKTRLSGREEFNPNLLEERDQALRLKDERLSTSSLDDPMDFLLELQSAGVESAKQLESKLSKDKLLE